MMKRNSSKYSRQMMYAQMDELQRIQYQRNEIRKELSSSRSHMQDIYQTLSRKDEVPNDRWGKTAYLLSRGTTIVNGIRVGFRVGKAINTIIQIKRLFSHRR